ncbi:MAG TPA: DUF6677 family protein [Myxococcota bacterium]|nr:DUF6677 family protein [Myxococcota bacterium]
MDKLRHPAVAAALSFLLPGVGQMVAGQHKKGAVMLLLSIATCYFAGLACPVAAIDAWVVADKLRKGTPAGEWECF